MWTLPKSEFSMGMTPRSLFPDDTSANTPSNDGVATGRAPSNNASTASSLNAPVSPWKETRGVSGISFQLSVVSCQLSVVSHQLSVISCQLSVVSCQLSVIGFSSRCIHYSADIVTRCRLHVLY